MPYDDHRDNPMHQPDGALLRPSYHDMGIDEVSWNVDGSITAIQSKRTGNHLFASMRVTPQYLLVDCSECAGQHGPAKGEFSADNLTAAASGAYFGDLNPANIIIGNGDRETAVLIDIGVYETAAVDLHEVLRGLMPDPDSPAPQVLATTRADEDHLLPAGLSGAPVLNSVDMGKVVRLLKHWRWVSRPDPQPSVALELLVGRTLTSGLVAGSARCAVRAAYLARDAVVQKGFEASRSAVAGFAERWLGLRPTDANIAATGNALLQAPLDGVHPSGDHAAVQQLRTDVRDQRRAWRLIGETQLFGRHVDSLDRPLQAAHVVGPLTVADTVAGGVPPDVVDGWSDERVQRVLARLRSDELRVALASAYQGLSWAAAAETCGMTAAFGERVRRKLKRLGSDLTARIDTVKGYPQPT